MPVPASKYKPLKEIVHEWSAQSGELPSVVLRHICDWAICDSFPDGTFIYPTGQGIPLLELHRAMRMATGTGAGINPDVARELLRVATVRTAGIEEYCERFGIQPPPRSGGVISRFRRLFEKRRYVSPPECPNSAATVAKLEAGASADGIMNTMERMLPRAPGPAVSEKTQERWLSYLTWARSEAEASKNPEILGRLNGLEQEWQVLTVGSPAVGEGSVSSDELTSAQSPERKKRSAGRPEGSGSLKAGDLKLVEEMRKGIISREYSSISAAARAVAPRAAGSGTATSIESRLVRRYADEYPD
jgi:hypothetical protein